MTFWILASLLVLLVLATALRPLLQRRSLQAPERQSFDLKVYRDQLAEIERDQARGVLNESEAAGARTEVERRILSLAGKADRAVLEESQEGFPKVLAASLAIALPAFGFALYWQLGSPDLPSMPLAERQDIRPAGEASQASEMAGMMEQLKDRLRIAPDDSQAWLMLGHLERRAGNLSDAINAYREAVDTDPESLDAKVSLAESLIGQSGGEVIREARLLLAEVLRIDAGNASARYYAGLAMAQDNRGEDAHAVWSALLRDSPPQAPWVPLLQNQLASLEQALGMTQTAPAAPGPSAEDIQAASEMTVEERQAFIRSMVASLAAKLEENPQNLDGWLRLIRAYLVLGEREKAQQALDNASGLAQTLADNDPKRQQLDLFRQELAN